MHNELIVKSPGFLPYVEKQLSSNEYFKLVNNIPKAIYLTIINECLTADKQDIELETLAVGYVIVNRYRYIHTNDKAKYWWGTSLLDICVNARQFRCWNNAHEVMSSMYKLNMDKYRDVAIEAGYVMDMIMDYISPMNDPTHGAMHYTSDFNLIRRYPKGVVLGKKYFYNYSSISTSIRNRPHYELMQYVKLLSSNLEP